MNRRKALSTSALLVGGVVLTSELLLRCAPERKPGEWRAEDINLLDEVGETILPASPSSPGAKEAKIGEFMKTMVVDCYDEADQQTFMKGIDLLSEARFMELNAVEKKDFLVKLDKEASENKGSDGRHYFSMMKQLALQGYFTSEVGATKALRYVPIPARYDGCVAYEKGQPAWA